MNFRSFIKLLELVIILFASLKSADNQHLQQNHLMDVINDLNTHLKLEWNAIIALDIQQDLESVIKSLKLPVVIITKKDEAKIQASHSRQFMAIVYMERSSVEDIYELVESSLELLQFTQILWIIPEGDGDEEFLTSLADKNWYSGFLKVLYHTQQGLFTYRPIPVIRIQRIFSVNEYMQRKATVDFQGHPMALPILRVPPRSYYYTNRLGTKIITGYMQKIIHTFVLHYNFKFKEVKVPKGGDLVAIEYLVAGVNNNTIDFMPLPFYVVNPDAGSKSDVLWNMKVLLVAPYPAAVSRSKYIPLPFTVGTKIAILLLLVFCVAAVSVVYFKPTSRGQFDFSKSFLYVLSLFIYQNQIDVKVKTVLQKLVYLLIFLVSFILTNMYLAKLSSLLVANIYEPKMKTFADLNKTQRKIVMHDTDYNYLYSISNLPADILKKATIENYTTIYGIQRNLDNNYLTIFYEDKMNFMLIQQQYLKTPRVYAINEALSEFPVYFTVRRNFPFLQLFNRYLRRIRESGILSKLVLETNFDGILSGETRFLTEPDSSGVLAIDFEFFFVPFCYFLIGLFVALVMFVLELIYFKFVKKVCVK